MSADYDSVVVGGGAAGLSAALVLGRARRRTLVLDAGGQSNLAAKHVGGLLGHDGTPPRELYELARSQVLAYESVELREAEAAAARPAEDGFVVTIGTGEEVSASSLVLATGVDYEVPDVPGFAELWGDSVFHCPFCHGWDVRDRRVAVFADGQFADRFEALISGWTDDVVKVDPSQVIGVRTEDGSLRALELRDGSEVACDAVLVHVSLRQRGSLPGDLGLDLTDDGFVAVDAEMHTSVPGVYAAGDAAIAPQQVAIAIGSGHTAGLVATRELLISNTAARSPQREGMDR